MCFWFVFIRGSVLNFQAGDGSKFSRAWIEEELVSWWKTRASAVDRNGTALMVLEQTLESLNCTWAPHSTHVYLSESTRKSSVFTLKQFHIRQTQSNSAGRSASVCVFIRRSTNIYSYNFWTLWTLVVPDSWIHQFSVFDLLHFVHSAVELFFGEEEFSVTWKKNNCLLLRVAVNWALNKSALISGHYIKPYIDGLRQN